MPTYEYACRQCKRHTEAVQSFTDPPLTECPHCGGELKRVFHPVGILLKGSGFYSTDNRSSKRPLTQPKDGAEAKPDAAAASDTAGSAATTASESKPAAKKDPPAKKTEKKK